MSNYQNSNNNNRDGKTSVFTSCMTMKNGNQEHPCAVQITFWDDVAKIQFSPELPESEQTQMRRYDYNNSITTSLTRLKANELVNQYKKIFLPALEKKEDISISVPIAGIHQMQLQTNIVNGEPKPRLRFIQNINSDTLKAPMEQIMSYEFIQGEYIVDYNPETGQFKDRVITNNELDLFMGDLEAFNDAVSHAYTHSNRMVDRAYKDSIQTKLNRIGEANGIHFDDQSRNRYAGNGRGGQGSIYDRPSTNNAETTQIGSMEELDNAMANGGITQGEDELPFN